MKGAELKQICLNVIYNHRYDNNIHKLNNIYHGRFSHVYHLMPFYDGKVNSGGKSVIPVFESSHNFEGFFQQAFSFFYHTDYDYYCFVADDLLLNPRINETNISEWFPINDKTAFIKELVPLTKKRKLYYIPYTGYYFTSKGLIRWDKIEENNHGIYIKEAKGCLKDSRFLQISKCLGESEEIVKKFKKMGLNIENADRKYGNGYPLLLSFSDLVIVPKQFIQRFCYLCGVFAAANLHVELAIPTALAMSCDWINTEEQQRCKGRQLHYSPTYIKSYQDIINEFDEMVSWIHPIKLSKIEV